MTFILGVNDGSSPIFSLNVLENNYSNNYTGPVAYHLIRHYVASTQYDVQIQKDRMVLSPMVTVRAASFVAPQLDAGLMLNMKEYGYLGAMYRSNYAATLNAGVHLTPMLSVGYSHEFSTNAFASSLGMSNEFMLSYRFGDNKRNSRLEAEVKRLKDKQRQASKETEKLLNERLEEFKDELGAAQKVELEKQTESLKKNLQEEGLKLQEAGNQRRSRQEESSMNSYEDLNSNNSVQRDGVIKGYRNENYANNVTPGSPGYYVTAGVYGESSNANRQAAKLSNRGIQANVFRDSRNDMFYVYLLKFPSYQQADSAKDSGLRGQYTGKLWIKVVK